MFIFFDKINIFFINIIILSIFTGFVTILLVIFISKICNKGGVYLSIVDGNIFLEENNKKISIEGNNKLILNVDGSQNTLSKESDMWGIELYITSMNKAFYINSASIPIIKEIIKTDKFELGFKRDSIINCPPTVFISKIIENTWLFFQ
ncbi:hypothetical protein [Hymenobacter sp.]|uniref:hypothetical protein n=1 Tax=Hymenobacter sp. TaxID=1898978 RepID=UPI002ED85977